MSGKDDYTRTCKNCGNTITMSIRSGKWAPYDGNEFHSCPAAEDTPATEKAQLTQEDEETINQYLDSTKQKQEQRAATAEFARHSTSLCRILYGGIDDVEVKYQYLTNKIRKYLGKVHGSQHTFTETIKTHYIVVYFEVPNSALGEFEA